MEKAAAEIGFVQCPAIPAGEWDLENGFIIVKLEDIITAHQAKNVQQPQLVQELGTAAWQLSCWVTEMCFQLSTEGADMRGWCPFPGHPLSAQFDSVLEFIGFLAE